MEGGVRKFVDPQVENDCLNKVRNSKGADYYGLTEDNLGMRDRNFSPLVLTIPGSTNYQTFFRSYQAHPDIDNVTRNMLCSNGVEKNGRASNGDNSELVGNVENYYWGEFMGIEVAKILQAKPGAEFDAAWDEVYNNFIAGTNYAEAKAAMTEYFKEYPPIK
jgi:hypothetical protein